MSRSNLIIFYFIFFLVTRNLKKQPVFFLGDLNNWAVGWIDWNILLDKYGGPRHTQPDDCEGPHECGCASMMMADIQAQVVYKQVFYYYMAQLSKFISPG